jgi:hypothetical protein
MVLVSAIASSTFAIISVAYALVLTYLTEARRNWIRAFFNQRWRNAQRVITLSKNSLMNVGKAFHDSLNRISFRRNSISHPDG